MRPYVKVGRVRCEVVGPYVFHARHGRMIFPRVYSWCATMRPPRAKWAGRRYHGAYLRFKPHPKVGEP